MRDDGIRRTPRQHGACVWAEAWIARTVSISIESWPVLFRRGWVMTKVGYIEWVRQFWNEAASLQGRHELLIVQGRPVEAAVPLVLLDVFGAILR